MSIKWFLSWILMFPLLKFLTGIEIYGSVPRKGAFILACNHVSFLDPPVVGITACREIYFLAKPGLFASSRFFAWLIRTYNAMSTGGTEGIKRALRLLKAGNVVVIFPEGTRSRKGYMLDFNPGVAYLSITLGIPVIPAYITHSNKKFVSLVLRLNKLKITYGSHLYPTGYSKTREAYQMFASRIRDEVLKLR
jgi:1-acyl-sn-glycerol-3-phosphate acyltransferase